MKTAMLIILCSVLNVAAFEVGVYSEQIPESNPVTRVRVTHLRTQFSFIPPQGWIFGCDTNAQRAWVASADSQKTIMMTLITNSMPATAAQFRDQVVGRWDNARVVQEFVAPSGGSPGLGIDVLRKLNDQVWVMTRVCVYKAAGRTIEVSMSVRRTDWDELHDPWTSFINSFRVEEPQVSVTLRKQE